jgi:hypothetical protein
MINSRVKIYLDDIRIPVEDGWTVVRNFEEFKTAVQTAGLENIECISFDHDLGESAMDEYFRNVRPNYKLEYENITEKTGYDCAKWLVDYAISNKTVIPQVYIHSANPVGAANIFGYINNYYKNFRVGLTAQIMNWKHTYSTIID